MRSTLCAKRASALGISGALVLGATMFAAGADTPVTDWPAYNRLLTSERYAPFTQINTTNVSQLKQLCVYDLGVEVNFQAGPIVIGRTLYVTTDKDTAAIDADTCQQKWRVHEDGPSIGLRVNRGAAYLDGRLFRGSEEGDVLAYDAESGKKLWRTHIADSDKAESVPAAPIAWSGLVFIGTAGSDSYGVKGRMYALDAATGKIVWETYTVPTDVPQPRNEKMQARAKATWSNPNGVPITGGGSWTSYSLDPARGLLYVPVGNPGPDFTNRVRVGDNLYTNSVLILDAKTGIYKKHYSLVPADFHDWDVAAAPVLVTTKGGKRIVAAAPKDGMLYANDLRSDKRLYATPITTRENVDTPLSTTPTRFCPGVGGGSEWNGPAYSPQTNLFYDGTADWCVTVTLDPAELSKKPRQSWTGAERGNTFGKRDTNWSGWVVATDADAGQVRWRFHAPAPVLSGITPTGGGLVFAADMANHAYAFDAADGELRWQTELPGAPAGGVITYVVGGNQRIAFVAGTRGGLFTTTPASAKIVVFGLPAGRSANSAAGWTVPRLADGHPDMQGVWANNSMTPLQRPSSFGMRPTMTDAELDSVQKTAKALMSGGDAFFGDELFTAAVEGKRTFRSSDTETGNYDQTWLSERVFDHRTSLIIDPPDGRIPALVPQALARAREQAAVRRTKGPADQAQDLSLSTRCITFGTPNIFAGYQSYFEISQGPGIFALGSEMMHDMRIFPVGAGPHPSKKLLQYHGDSRARWEGDTLVVDTTNFAPGAFRNSTEQLHVTEEFKRVAEDTVEYYVTIDDPLTWSRPWTLMILLKKTGERMFEYACHEGNYSLRGILSGAREQEAELRRAGR